MRFHRRAGRALFVQDVAKICMPFSLSVWMRLSLSLCRMVSTHFLAEAEVLLPSAGKGVSV